jgi:hypothetical protein
MKRILAGVAITLMVVGVGSVAGGVAGAAYTRDVAAAEKVYAHEDSSRPGELVAGPVTMKAQADVILEHTLTYTEGKRFSEMSSDDEYRDLWHMSTTWRNALNMGIMAFMLSAFAIVQGLALFAAGVGFGALALRE